jgi:hypothetical protein
LWTKRVITPYLPGPDFGISLKDTDIHVVSLLPNHNFSKDRIIVLTLLEYIQGA